MITRQEFPYLQELIIGDAYAVKNLRIVVSPSGELKHLILTGGNGSGKTTALRGLFNVIEYDVNNFKLAKDALIRAQSSLNHSALSDNQKRQQQKIVEDLGRVTPLLRSQNGAPYDGLRYRKDEIITAFFGAIRTTHVKEVVTVIKDDDLLKQVRKAVNASYAEFFKQYLVNKKVSQTFDVMDGKLQEADRQEKFFTDLETQLKGVFSDPGLKLEFVRENFEFYLVHSDGRRITFNQLSAGFSAFLSILMDLLMRVDLLRKQANDYTYDPCGFVLIDEPETHLHLEMQYQILPLLTNLFPNLQFIVATHSPAVASSIKNATVFDLSTGQALGDQAAGSSFSELMQTHFGLENEYSNVADKILDEVAEIGQMADRAAALARLRQLLEEQGKYMSPVLRLDVQAQLLHLQREQAA
jgi:predicted ATPase